MASVTFACPASLLQQVDLGRASPPGRPTSQRGGPRSDHGPPGESPSWASGPGGAGRTDRELSQWNQRTRLMHLAQPSLPVITLFMVAKVGLRSLCATNISSALAGPLAAAHSRYWHTTHKAKPFSPFGIKASRVWTSPSHLPTVACPARRARYAGAFWCTCMIAWHTHRLWSNICSTRMSRRSSRSSAAASISLRAPSASLGGKNSAFSDTVSRTRVYRWTRARCSQSSSGQR